MYALPHTPMGRRALWLLLPVVLYPLITTGPVEGPTWQVSAISELNLAAPFILLALVLVAYAKRRGWGDLGALPYCSGR